MSYPKDLDEYSWMALQGEISDRLRLQKENKCTYCRQPRDSVPACKFPDRHNGTEL